MENIIKTNPSVTATRSSYVLQLKDSPADGRIDASQVPTIVCRDCKSAVTVASLIAVDALHVQCPLCLYVFFMETLAKKS